MKPLNFILWLAWAMLPFAVHSQDTLTAIDLNQNLGNGWPPVPTVGNEPYFHWYGTGNQINDTYLNRGTGMVVGATLAGGFVGSGFTDHSLAEAIANNRYYEFSTTPAYGVITIMALDCYLYRSTNGPVWYQWMISSDDFTTTSVPLGDSVLFTGFDSAGIQQPEINTRLTSGFQYLASGKYYRLYAWGGSDTAGVFGFGRPPHSSSITTLGRGADHYQSYAVGASWGWSVPGFFTTQGNPSPAQQIGIGFSGITDTITMTMSQYFEFSRDSVNWTHELKFDPYRASSPVLLWVRATASAPPSDITGNMGLSTPGQLSVGGSGQPTALYATVYPADRHILWSTNFNDCAAYTTAPPGEGFTAYNISGDASIWSCSPYGRDPAQITGERPGHGPGIDISPGGNYPVPPTYIPDEDWLVSPRFDLSATHNPVLNFWSRAGQYTYWPLQLKVSTDYTGSGDPRTAHWTNINGHFPDTLTDIWTESSNIDLSAYRQNGVYFAYVFKAPGTGGTGWSIDDFILFDLDNPLPTLNVSSNSLELGYAAAGNTVNKKLTITTTHLPGSATVTSPGSDFQVSTDSVNFGTTAAVSGDTTEYLYVRFAPSSNNVMYADSLKVVAPDTTATISLKGNSLPPASTMSIVSWNLDYFGSPEWGAGPIDKSSQTAAIGAILPSLHADVYALQEVVNESSLQAIVASMPGYAYSISTYGSHSNPSDPTPATLDTVQKLAFVYDTVKVKNIQLNSLLTTGTRLPADVATRYYSDWTNGRYPYMLTASVTLDNRNGDTIVRKIRFINIHATVGNQLTAYNSRWRGAFALDSLIQSNYKNDNVIVLGDYNDDLNRSVTSGKDTSSYMPFIRDSQLYQFPTRTLDLQNENSEINKTGVLENMLLNNSTAAWYLPFSATVLSEVSSGNSSFGSTVTSHYPVVTQLSFAPPIVPLPVTLLNFNAVKHGTGAKVSWTTTQETNSDHFDVQRSGDNRNFTTIATVAAQGNRQTATDYRCTDVSPLMGDNYYRLRPVDKDGHSTLSKTVLLDFNSMTVRLSPNPAHGTVNLFFGKTSEPLFIQIVDGSGQVVSQFRSTGGTTSYLIDVSQYPKGVYVVKVTGAATTVTQKLLVQ